MSLYLVARIALFSVAATTAFGETPQVSIERIDLISSQGLSIEKRDWQVSAERFDRLVFDRSSVGEYLPISWIDDSRINFGVPMLGLPSYLGNAQKGSDHEAVATLGVLLGSTLAGIDKSKGEIDFIAGIAGYFNSRNGQDVVLNHTSTVTGNTFWYEIYPQILFNAIGNRYPDHVELSSLRRRAADRWHSAIKVMPRKDGRIDFNHTAFDLQTMKPVDNGKWKEPDAAAGLAWVFLSAHSEFGDDRYLESARQCVESLEANPRSPLYEVMLPFGALAAARLNAEHGTDYDVEKLISWSFGPSGSRPGWGLIVGDWNGHNCSGFIGSITDSGGYGFAMNTFAYSMALVPIVKYDDRFAEVVGRFVLHADNAARLLFPDALPAENQSCPGWKSDPPDAIPYEGIRRHWNGKRPVAMGDPTVHGWGPSDLSIYGGGLMGTFAAQFRRTEDPQILQIDVNATDFFAARSYPTYLYYNPHDKDREITMNVDVEAFDLYDRLANRVIARNAKKPHKLMVPAKSARLVILLPVGSELKQEARRTLVEDVVIDCEPLTARASEPAPPVDDMSHTLDAPKRVIRLDGDLSDWPAGATTIALDTGGRGQMRAELSFCWDENNLYIRAMETTPSALKSEVVAFDIPSLAPPTGDAIALYFDAGNGKHQTASDIVIQAAFSTTRRENAIFSAMFDDTDAGSLRSVATTSREGRRVIESAIAWNAIRGKSFPSGITALQIGEGLIVTADPLLVENSHRQQSFRGGTHYDKPAVGSLHSTKIVLRK